MLPFITIPIITNQRLILLGITIFDITDLSHVSYCFVSFQGLEGRYEAPLMTPLSARTYLEAYYDLADPEHKDLLPSVESFKGWSLIPASVLENAWPGEGWNEAETDVQEGEGEEPDLQLTKLEISPKTTLSTLRGLTMDTVLQNLLDSPQENSSLMDEAEFLTDFLPRLKDKIYERAPTMKWSPYHLDLLCQALQNEAVVDLTPLTNVPAKDLAVVVEKLSRNGKMNILNLSNRPDIGVDDLRHIIGTVPNLRVLCLLEMPQIPLQSLNRYLVDFEIHHSGLLRSAFTVTVPHSSYRNYNDDVKKLHTKFRATGVVSQIVWTGLGWMESKERRNYLPGGRIAWEDMAFSSKTNQAIDGQTTMYKRTYDLSVPLPPYKLIPGVLRLLQWAGASNLDDFLEPSRGMACSLASLLPHSDGTGHGVSLLDPSVYLLRDTFPSPEAQSPFCLDPGEWALFLVSEAFDVTYEVFVRLMEDDEKSSEDLDFKFSPRKATSYALVTRVPGSEPPQYMVADIPTFLKDVLGDTPEAQELLDAWTGGFPSIRDAEFLGDDTYKILRKLSEDTTQVEKEAQDCKEGTEDNGTGDIQSGSTNTGDHGSEVH